MMPRMLAEDSDTLTYLFHQKQMSWIQKRKLKEA